VGGAKGNSSSRTRTCPSATSAALAAGSERPLFGGWKLRYHPPALESGARHHRSAGVGRPLAETGTRDRGMDDKALEELCKWHDEQAAMLRSEAGNLAAAAVAADMHAKTSAALHEAATEIKQLRLEAGLSASDPPAKTSDRSISNIPAPIFWSLAAGQVVFLGWLILETLGWL
jgi:hypothetical protein